MAHDLIFYTNPMSRGRIARWMLEEVGAPYETVIVDLSKIPDDYRRINPMAKVPSIVHRGRTVTEAAAICAYLADAVPAAKLAPSDAERASYYRWLFFSAGPLEAAMVNQALGVEVPVERERMVGYGSHARTVAALEQAVSASDYVAGARFTAADVYVGSQIHWGIARGSLPKRPAFDAYLGRVMGRPAAARAREIDDDLVRKYAAGA